MVALIAIAGGGYYFWSEKRKKAWGVEEAEDTGHQDPAGKNIVPKEKVITKPDGTDTVVKVTILKDIPDKETGKKDTKEKRK